MGHYRRNKNWNRVYHENGSYSKPGWIMDEPEEIYTLTDDELLQKHGIYRREYGLYTYDPEQAVKDAVSALENRDALDIARRNRRRVFAPQDDRRLKDPNIEDFNHVPERQFHDINGKVQSIRRRDLPVNVNRNQTSTRRFRLERSQSREVIDRLRASICGKRKSRREVLFATKKTGAGAKARKHLWSKVSKIICK